jgi:hypothetical protein
MKVTLLLIMLIAVPKLFFGQEMQQPQLSVTLDSIIKVTGYIDGLNSSFKKAFTLSTQDSNDKRLLENWQFTYSPASRLVFFQVSRHEDSSYYEEDYYLGDSGLIFTEEKHIRYMPHRMGNKDSSHWMEECYFLNNRLIHEISHGHGITETDDYDPGKAVLARFNKRLEKLMSHLMQRVY